jgi:hypothetical protein
MAAAAFSGWPGRVLTSAAESGAGVLKMVEVSPQIDRHAADLRPGADLFREHAGSTFL